MTDTSLPMSSETVSDERLDDLGARLRLQSGTRQFLVTEETALEAANAIEALRSKPVASGVEVRPELLAAASSLQDITFRANELGIGLAKYPVGEIEAVLQFVSQALSALLPKATAPVVSEPDAYVDWKSQCIYPAENIKDPTGLQPVWYTSPQPQPKAVTEEMVERAARAISPHLWKELTHEQRMSDDYAFTNRRDAQDRARKQARAALEAAMKEA